MESITVRFDRTIQALEPLQEAAYRLIGTASCHFVVEDQEFVCTLTPAGRAESSAIRSRFHDLVTDENIRARVASRTEKVRDLILSLAFGALAAPQSDPAKAMSTPAKPDRPDGEQSWLGLSEQFWAFG
jgi:His-Xaa-Ser system protein HxsD